jgi:hypothetical protein
MRVTRRLTRRTTLTLQALLLAGLMLVVALSATDRAVQNDARAMALNPAVVSS